MESPFLLIFAVDLLFMVDIIFLFEISFYIRSSSHKYHNTSAFGDQPQKPILLTAQLETCRVQKYAFSSQTTVDKNQYLTMIRMMIFAMGDYKCNPLER